MSEEITRIIALIVVVVIILSAGVAGEILDAIATFIQLTCPDPSDPFHPFWC